MDRRLVVLAMGMFAIGTDSLVVAGILTEVSRSLEATIAQAGQMVTLYAVSYAVMSPVVAAAAARWPRKRLLLSGLGVFVMANALTAMAPTLGMVLGTRVAAGFGAAMFGPTATATGASLVPPEQRGRALAIIIAGLSTATALGAPIGTVLGGLGDWRLTMWFVAALGLVSAAGVWLLLPEVPAPAPVGLRQRLAPLGDSRVALTLLTTFAFMVGAFVVYTYIGVTFDRMTGGDGTILAGLLLLWGIAATAGNLGAGWVTDHFGSRRIINIASVLTGADFGLMPWTSAHLATGAAAVIVWGVCGWGLLVPQQHRLIGLAPAMAPVLMGLHTAAIYVGVSASGVIGAAAIASIGKYYLGVVGAAFVAIALLAAELAHWRISSRRHDASRLVPNATEPL